MATIQDDLNSSTSPSQIYAAITIDLKTCGVTHAMFSWNWGLGKGCYDQEDQGKAE